jgi:hypothetical protein
VSQSFTVSPAPTTLTAAKAKHSASSVTYSATLTQTYGSSPIGGQKVTFTLSGQALCSATSSASGAATCSVSGVSIVVGSVNYTATFAGSTDYDGSTGSAAA